MIIRAIEDSDVTLVDSMGSDLKVYQMARQSYGANADTPDDKRLNEFIGRLIANEHLTPFEHCSVTYKIKAPIASLRQVMRYRTAVFSEKSLRFSPATLEFDNSLCELGHGCVIADFFEIAAETYRALLGYGVPKELARDVLPVSLISEVYMTINLRNLFHLFDQRLDQHAQERTRRIARMMYERVGKVFPICMRQYKLNKKKREANEK